MAGIAAKQPIPANSATPYTSAIRDERDTTLWFWSESDIRQPHRMVFGAMSFLLFDDFCTKNETIDLEYSLTLIEPLEAITPSEKGQQPLNFCRMTHQLVIFQFIKTCFDTFQHQTVVDRNT